MYELAHLVPLLELEQLEIDKLLQGSDDVLLPMDEVEQILLEVVYIPRIPLLYHCVAIQIQK